MKTIVARPGFCILLFCLFFSSSIAQDRNSLTISEKIYGLSKFWSEATYNFSYSEYLHGFDPDSAYQVFLDKVIATSNDYEYYNVLSEFAALYRDNHTYVIMPDDLKGKLYRSNFTQYRINLSSIDGKVIVSHTGSDSRNEIPVGTEILKVDGKPTFFHLKENVLPYISASSDEALLRIGTRFLLLGLNGTTTNVTVKTPEGIIKELELRRGRNDEEWYPAFTNKPFHVKTEKNISILRVNTFSEPNVLDSLISEIQKIKTSDGIILDIRGNGGGSSIIAKDIAKYFLSDSLITGSNVRSRSNIGFYRARGLNLSDEDTIGNNANKMFYQMAGNRSMLNLGNAEFVNDLSFGERILSVPVVILIDAFNVSAAEEFLVYLSGKEHITLIGETTGGGNGQPMIFDLPGGGKAALCTQLCRFPDGRDYYRVGIKPDIEVKQTIEDLISGKDTVLEYAKSFLEMKMNLDE
jgi:C-terminal processing protease CtpA/Prc